MNEFVPRAVCEERKKSIDERCHRDKEAIESIEKNIATLTQLVTELATMQKTNAETQRKNDERIRALELRPGGKWDKFTGAAIAAIGGALAGYIVNGLS